MKIKKLLYGMGLSFLAGALFYLFFRQSFGDVYDEIVSSMAKWQQQKGIFSELYHSLWNHGKFFVILWIFSVNRTVVHWYIRLFLGYTGIRNGFLFLFFVMNRGWMGVLCYLASLFPHCILFSLIYLYSFALIERKRQQKHKMLLFVAMLSAFVAACLTEVYFNLPIMQKLLCH
ncbi:MAG: hypothetical protein SOT18_00340 [Eubacterium sp.]|nr:hypothetical protein [Eubacterium sp.]